MSVKFNSVGTIKTRLGIQRNGPAHKEFADSCRKRMNERYVPSSSKANLIKSSRTDKNCNIVYETPYAHYLYVGKLYVDPNTGSSWAKYHQKKVPTDRNLNYHKAGTGPRWDKKMVSVEMKSIEKEIRAYVEKGCK